MPSPDSPGQALLVEGPDDEHVVRHLCEQFRVLPSFEIIQKEGIRNLLPSIPIELNVSGRKVLGILVDANDNPEARWQAIMDKLSKLNAELPSAPMPMGTIIEGNPRVGIWMMPDNMAAGELENFIALLIPQHDPVWPLSQAYIRKIPPKERRFAAGKTLRAQVHAWLAARERPRRMGAAIGAGDLDTTVKVSRDFTAWLQALFTLTV